MLFIALTAWNLPHALMATELLPWFDPLFEFQPRLSYRHHHYHSLDTANGSVKRASEDHYLHLSMGFSPHPSYAFETELLLVNTRKQGFALDGLKMTGRYLFWDDVAGDPLSVSLGGTLGITSNSSVKDLSLMHHGQLEAEAHLAIGKELSYDQFWSTRAFAVVAYGVSEEGSPWMKWHANIEKNFRDKCSFRLFAKSHNGLGNKKLDLSEPFRGYGSIQHQSIDLGALCHIEMKWDGMRLGVLSVEYSYRTHARNCPENVHAFAVTFLSPFGL